MVGTKITVRGFKKQIAFSAAISFYMFAAAIGYGQKNCDLMQIMKEYYDSTDAQRYGKSISFFTDDAELITWTEGVNGRRWQEKHYHGDQIRNVLNRRGLRRVSESASSPIFHETEVKASSNEITFMLRPDRLGPRNKMYNPYQVNVTFENCRIKTMTVIELISWI